MKINMISGLKNKSVFLAIILGLGLSACATKPPANDPVALATYKEKNDPFEPLNRATFNFSNTLDSVTLKPLAKGYRAVVPQPARKSIRNFVNNVQEPWSFINLLLQGKPSYAGEVLGRFVVNSTIGVAGFFDQATPIGLDPHEEDFGQTLAVWGVPEGPYIYVPLLGPSNPRDFTGFAAQFFGDPVSLTFDYTNHENVGYGITSGQIVDTREALLDIFDPILEEGGDPYATLRSSYRQNRKFDISDGEIDEDEQEDLFGDDPIN
ncbi:MAG: VacJ family lipoprotein [Sphingomonadales bacterium]|jgi:phospholipid-binding lipoprotein MlaA